MKYPRSLAVRVLTQVLSRHQSLDEVLAHEAAHLEPEAAAWLLETTAGTLRWKGRLDWIVDAVADRKKPSGWLRKILLLAAYQLVVQDRAPEALVVSETVEEIKRKEGDSPAKFANACLRKISNQSLQWRNWAYPQNLDPMSPQAAAWASLPPWFWNKLVHQRGVEWAQKFAEAALQRPRLWLRSRDSMVQPGGFDSLEPGTVPGSWVATQPQGGSIASRSGFSQGEWMVQDISSQYLIDQVVTAVRSLEKKKALTALDLCAAPGGKSVGLAWNGFRVTATEFRADRVALLQETMSRTAADIEYLPWDQVAGPGSRTWDLVWVDSPCSGSGIIRRHPDVRWLRQEKEIQTLVQEQKKIIRDAWNKTAPGGFLVFSVCSVFSDEGERIISDFIQDAAVHGASLPKPIQQWSLSPHLAPFGDGFWGALVQKV